MMTHQTSQQTTRYARPSARGFTLLEVMVALVIFSIGLLGLAALQGRAVSYNAGAYHRSLANFMVNDIMDRMRANRTYALSNGTSSPYKVGYGGVPPAPTCDSSGANCDDVAQKSADLYEWKQALAVLPSGDGKIDSSAGSGGSVVFTVTIEWKDPNTNNASGYSQLAVKGEL